MRSLTLFRLKALVALVLCFVVGYQHGVNAGAFCAFCSLSALSMQMRPLHLLGANTFDAAFVTDIATDKAITVLQTKLAALNLYSTKFTADPIAPKKNILVELVTGAAAVQTNPSNFEQGGDTTTGKISVAVNHLYKNFHLEFGELQQGFGLENTFGIQLRTLANAIIDVAKTPLTAANYGAPILTVAAADMGQDDLKALLAGGKDFEVNNLVLDGGHLAQLMPTDKNSFAMLEAGAYGFDQMARCNRWNGAEANVVGTYGGPDGLAVASGLPVLHEAVEKDFYASEQIQIPDIGITVMFNMWASKATRTVWGSYEVMFGAAKGDATKLKLIKKPA